MNFERVAGICGVPKDFAALVLKHLPSTLPAAKCEEYIQFVDDVIRAEGLQLDDRMEFFARALASSNDVPVSLARFVIKAEIISPLRDDEHTVATREERLALLQKVFADVQGAYGL